MYKEKDISVVIPTYNRATDLRKTLISLSKNSSNLKEIIIVDQSKNKETKELCKKFKSRIENLVYLHSSTPSITIARNLGVKNSSNKTKLIYFFDDDISIGKSYFKETLNLFNKGAFGVGGFIFYRKMNPNSFSNILKKFFFLGFIDKNQARIVSAYGNTYPSEIEKTIESQWLPGANMAYRKYIFSEQRFDENLLGYTIAEDIDFSYNVYKKNPGKVFVTPKAKIVHRVSMKERYPTKKLAYINQIDHFYFQLKNLNGPLSQKLIFIWSIFGISILRISQAIKTRKKEDFLKMSYFFESLLYCLINLKKIRSGNLRDFKEFKL